MKKLIISSTILFFIFTWSCEFWQNNVIISLGSLPLQDCEKRNPGSFKYRLVYYNNGPKEIELEDRNSELLMDLGSESDVPFLIYPVVKGIRLKPAGGIYPCHYDESSHHLKIDWRTGPLAETAFKLSSANFDLHNFNLLKLEKYLNQKFPDNPWDWDRDKFLTSVLKGDADYFDIHSLSHREISVPLSAGQYYGDQIFTGNITIHDKGSILDLYSGYNCIFNGDFSIIYHINVSERDVSVLREKIDERKTCYIKK